MLYCESANELKFYNLEASTDVFIAVSGINVILSLYLRPLCVYICSKISVVSLLTKTGSAEHLLLATAINNKIIMFWPIYIFI